MTEGLMIVAAVVTGLALGSLFFGGLWWTVRKGLASGHPAVWFLGSLLVRTGITVAGFYIVCRGHWQRAVGCLVGFAIARLVTVQLTRPRPSAPLIPPHEEPTRAS